MALNAFIPKRKKVKKITSQKESNDESRKRSRIVGSFKKNYPLKVDTKTITNIKLKIFLLYNNITLDMASIIPKRYLSTFPLYEEVFYIIIKNNENSKLRVRDMLRIKEKLKVNTKHLSELLNIRYRNLVLLEKEPNKLLSKEIINSLKYA